jgi:RNA polymerase sigma factor (sigma-70 family)
MPDDETIPTRGSMLDRLKDPADRQTWEEFHRTYRGLIQGVARRAGLSETEAEEVLQETLIAVAKKMPELRYDPAKDSFKGWLLQIIRWRIADQFRKRAIAGQGTTSAGCSSGVAMTARPVGPQPPIDHSRGESESRTATIERVPDPAGLELTAIWDAEWASHLLQTALARIKRQVNPAQYEIYYLHVIAGKPVGEVKQTLGVNVGQIYLAKHRVGRLLKAEIRKLEAALL